MTTPQSRFGIGTLEKTLAYHEEPKHHLERYPRSVGYVTPTGTLADFHDQAKKPAAATT
jgi:hypothetical protein